jgi:hypothetical protein
MITASMPLNFGYFAGFSEGVPVRRWHEPAVQPFYHSGYCNGCAISMGTRNDLHSDW